ncbi:Pleiotropic negative transcriptional regulator, partial [Rhizophlyctis rosea]
MSKQTSLTPVTYDLDTVGYHRTLDPIENLKLKIRFAKIADKNVPLSSATPLQLNGQVTNASPTNLSLPKPEELTVRWQQKVFSPREVIDYCHLTENATPLQKKYYGRLQTLMSRPNSREARLAASGDTLTTRKRLFTYVDGDAYIPTSTLLRPLTSTPYSRPAPSTDQRLLTLRERCIAELDDDGHLVYQRRLAKQRAERARVENAGFEGRKEVLKEGEGREREVLDGSIGEMHLMAFLHWESEPDENEPRPRTTSRRNNTPANEIVKRLCTIQAYKNSLIAISPDFTNPNQRFRFEIGEDVYEYTIQEVSPKLSASDEEKEQKIFAEVYAKQRQLLASHLPQTFTPPPDLYSLRLDIFGEIVDARRFSPGTLYIDWGIDFPYGWKEEDDLGCGQTQRSESVYDGETGGCKAVFGAGLETGCLAVRFDKIREWPRLYFQVNSVDYWDRHTVEGYGYIDMPRTPGCYSFDVQTWRPFGTFKSRLESFFIGGSPELEDVTYTSVPKGFDDKRLNKFGFVTETSGTVTIRLNVVHQA